MGINTQVHTNSHGDLTIYMKGGLDFENSIPLKKELEVLIEEHPASTITINLESLDFVGSSGINLFVDTIKSLNEHRSAIKLSNVKNEFLQIFKLYNLDLMDILVDKFEDDDTENLSMRFSNRSKTYEC